MAIKLLKEHECFGGRQAYFEHRSYDLGCDMRFGVYFPPGFESTHRWPALTYLAGLTCTEETFLMKGGAQRYAARHGIVLIAPDTSPRGAGIEGEDDDWDFGTGAGFYINATNAEWATNYHMEDYVSGELQQIMREYLNVDYERQGIFGHSMGGHGALTLSVKHANLYKSVSAFAPICAPTQCPWGQKAFGGYLGENHTSWSAHDAVELIRAMPDGERKPLLIDQGLADEFLDEQLKPHLLEAACAATSHPLTLRRHDGYDHSYYFISTFMEDHLDHHAKVICSG
jgi:S-formylglutathione hydrolase